MSISRNIKDNRIIRGSHFLFSDYFGWRKSGFGHYGRGVVVTPPFSGYRKNIFIYDNVGMGPYAHLSAVNAKIIFKGNSAIAEHLTIHTGNHARIVG